VEREITLREYGRVVWSGRWVILACAVGAALIALALSLLATTTYTATAEVTLGQATTIAGTPVSTPATNPATAATVLGADRLVVNVAEELDIDPGEVRSAVTLNAPRTAGGAVGNQPTLIVVSWQDTDKEAAERGANAYAREIERFMLDTNSAVVDTYAASVERARADIERLSATIDQYSRQLLANPPADARLTLQSLLQAATSQLSAAQVQLADQQVALAKAQTIEQPDILSLAEDAASSAGVRNLARTVILGGIIGLILGIIITFIWRGSPAGRAARDH
jgi:capsular polysaccharide biosynthesis protein